MRNIDTSFNIFIHKLPMELVPEAVVDEGGLLVVRLGPGAILEDHVVVPPLLDLHVGLALVRVFLLQ